ncbi:MAG: DNA mismatch endonuclease Vsr [Sphingomonas sp.]|nr:DNA mismatch endonuclease Vsr [Sphingomonas sp.]THD37321.1 MAG: DNA mismatch endonuclease Vsr [Sphingomonas sp.]
MADVVDSKTRSRMMAGIRGKDTKPELLIRRALHRSGFRFRLHDSRLPGRPDLVFPKYRAVLFVHGCYWHRHQACRLTTTPATNSDFWKSKFEGNVERDARKRALLLGAGWRVGVVWECATRRSPTTDIVKSISDWLVSHDPIFSFPD